MENQQDLERYKQAVTYRSQDAEFNTYVSTYMAGVYGWMFLGLTLTALVSYYLVSNTSMLMYILSRPVLFFGLMIGELIIVGYLALRVHKMSVDTARFIFFLYALLNGITLSALFLMYSGATIAVVFGITAVTFGIMSAVGYFTHQDLSKFGSILFMLLIGVIVASLANIFMKSSTLYWIISYVGVAIFVGLIAYDTQKIKAYALMDSEDDRKKGAIMGALALYLDFINLFIFLLRIFGGSRN
jgi:FtsH-binding integral membrane protein